jgi:hypothetical protein
MGSIAVFGSVPVFFACHLVVGDLAAMAVTAAFAISIIIVVSSWALHSERWFWPVMVGSFAIIATIHWWIVEPLSRLSEGYLAVACVAGGLAEFLAILKVVELFERRTSS